MKKLSRDEMKNVMGGDAPGGCLQPYILFCTTPNGTQGWCRSSNDGDATAVCRGIYPAYGDSVYGQWADNVILP